MSPYVNKLPKKPKSQRNEHTDMRELRKKAYADVRWKKLRILHLQEEPLCQRCLSKGKVNAGTLANPLHVHHKKSPFRNGEVNWNIMLDPDNLETLCDECHAEEHNAIQGHPSAADVIRALEALFDEVENNEDE